MSMFRQALLGAALALLALIVIGIASHGPVSALAQATTYRVCPAGPPACDFASIQAAVDASADGDLIQVAEGEYKTVQSRSAPAGYPGPATIRQVLYLTKSVTVQGGYVVGSWTDPDPSAHPTTLDAQGQGRALFVSGNVSPTVEGLILTGGDATGLGGTSWTDAGGGVYILTATLTLRNCRIEGNTAGTSLWGGTGGGLYLAFSRATIQDNVFRNNVAATAGEGYGGGISLYADLPATVRENQVYSNTASSGDWGYGGGLALYNSQALLSGNAVYSNTASSADQGYGGGLYIQKSSNTQVSSNTVRSNIASTAADGYGGGLYLSEADMVITHNYIQRNTASSSGWDYGYGGGLDLWKSNATLHRNIIQDNLAASSTWGYGGGLDLSQSNVTMVNNAILNNRAGGQGSGLAVSGGQQVLLHTTLAHNTSGEGSGLHLAGSSTALLTNTILVSHTVGITVAADSQASLDGILWSGNATNSGGGGTVSIAHAVSGLPAFAADGYHILATSAAVDAGIEAGVTTDIDGTPRPHQAPDLGADEYWPPSTPQRLYLPTILHLTP